MKSLASLNSGLGNITYVLECRVQFLSEKQTKLYEWYYWGVSQLKIVLDAKNGLQDRALPVLERRGA